MSIDLVNMDDSNTSSTPNTEFSPPCTPEQKKLAILRDTRLTAKKKLSGLTLEEKVFFFFFTESIT